MPYQKNVLSDSTKTLSEQLLEMINRAKEEPLELEKVMKIAQQLAVLEKRRWCYIDIAEHPALLEKRNAIIAKINTVNGYIVDIAFDENDTLQAVNHISLRSSGPQNRHITPISIIEKLIRQVLREPQEEKNGKKREEGDSPELILKSLLHKVEFFTADVLNKEDIEFQQDIFEYYRKPTLQYATDISILIKSLGYLYNHSPVLTLIDKKSAHNNQCYLVPLLSKHGKTYYHKNEGSFIVALMKALDILETKGIEKGFPLSDLDFKRVAYILTAMFDYPASSATLDFSGSFKYLYLAMARHVHFVLETYPAFKISGEYKRLITAFIRNVWFGISSKYLCQVMDVDSMPSLVKEKLAEKKITVRDAKKMFTAKEKDSHRKGFFAFYSEEEDYYAKLKKQIFEELQKHDSGFGDFVEDISEEALKEEEAKEKVSDRIYYIGEILYYIFCFDSKLNFCFANLPHSLTKILNITDKEKFHTLFVNFLLEGAPKFISILSEKFKKGFKTADKYDKLIKKYNLLKENMEFKNAVRSAIRKTYSNQVHENVVSKIKYSDLIEKYEKYKGLEKRSLPTQEFDSKFEEEELSSASIDESYELYLSITPELSLGSTTPKSSPLKSPLIKSKTVSPKKPFVPSSEKVAQPQLKPSPMSGHHKALFSQSVQNKDLIIMKDKNQLNNQLLKLFEASENQWQTSHHLPNLEKLTEKLSIEEQIDLMDNLESWGFVALGALLPETELKKRQDVVQKTLQKVLNTTLKQPAKPYQTESNQFEAFRLYQKQLDPKLSEYQRLDLLRKEYVKLFQKISSYDEFMKQLGLTYADEPSHVKPFENTVGDGNCFFHAAFATEKNIEKQWYTPSASEMRSRWFNFLRQYKGLRDTSMPSSVKDAVKKVLSILFQSSILRSKSFNNAVGGILANVQQKLHKAEIKSKKLRESWVNDIKNCEIKVKKVFHALIIYCLNRKDTPEHYQVIQQELNNVLSKLFKESQPSYEKNVSIDEVWKYNFKLIPVLTKNGTYLHDHLQENFKAFVPLYDDSVNYDKDLNEEAILNEFLFDEKVYEAYCESIKSSNYYISSEEIPILASLSETTIHLYARDTFSCIREILVIKPDKEVIQAYSPSYIWNKATKETYIFHEHLHYSRTTPVLIEQFTVSQSKSKVSHSSAVAFFSPVSERKGLPIAATGEKAYTLLKQQLPSHLLLGSTLGKGDSFFDAVAQALNQKEGKETYTAKTLRLLCYKTALKLDTRNQKSEISNWIQDFFKELNTEQPKDRLYAEYIDNICYTAKEIEQNLGTVKEAIAGRPELDGQILYTHLGITLHVINIQESGEAKAMEPNYTLSLCHQQINAQGSQLIEAINVNYHDENYIHLVYYKNHFVPLLKTQVPLEQTKKSEEKPKSNRP